MAKVFKRPSIQQSGSNMHHKEPDVWQPAANAEKSHLPTIMKMSCHVTVIVRLTDILSFCSDCFLGPLIALLAVHTFKNVHFFFSLWRIHCGNDLSVEVSSNGIEIPGASCRRRKFGGLRLHINLQRTYACMFTSLFSSLIRQFNSNRFGSVPHIPTWQDRLWISPRII